MFWETRENDANQPSSQQIINEIEKKLFEGLHAEPSEEIGTITGLQDPWAWIYGRHLVNLAVTGRVAPASSLLREIGERLEISLVMNEKVGIGGQTSLHIASKLGHQKFVEFLIENGADVNARDDNGCTPLWIASCNGHKEIVEILLRSKAIVEFRGKSLSHERTVKTPREIAKENGNVDIERMLKRAERKLSARWELQRKESIKNLKIQEEKEAKEREERERIEREEEENRIRQERLRIQREMELKETTKNFDEEEDKNNSTKSNGFFSRYLWGSSSLTRESHNGQHPREA